MEHNSVSIILPAKDEEESIGDVVATLAAQYPSAEVLVVDDGSTDNTAVIAMRSGAKVVSHKYSVGNGGAIKTGARAAKGEILVFMDADGQHDPRDIASLIERLNGGYDMVVGARQKGSQASVGRGIANKLYNLLAGYITSQKIDDLTSGFRVVRAGKFRQFLYLLPNKFSYPTTITMAFFRAGYSIAYEPIHTAERLGKSHLRPIKDGVRFLIIIFKVGSLYSPLKLFAPAAAFFFSLGLCWYGYTYSVEGRFTNMSALLMTNGFIIFMMGLISEQITALMYKDD